jgi:hypothetical protein
VAQTKNRAKICAKVIDLKFLIVTVVGKKIIIC